jgi:hypothetical protein
VLGTAVESTDVRPSNSAPKLRFLEVRRIGSTLVRGFAGVSAARLGGDSYPPVTCRHAELDG